ncbi:MAG: HD domain-containing protein [Bacteroidales bacterium]|nr:HD domain-containing protein [Bacteroidales bacterium]
MSVYHQTNKRKIINDPVYGFIRIPFEELYDIIEHPYFQRLRRIRQLGLTFYVYPGANHSRMQHALGTAHLMTTALDVLQQKGVEITEEERKAAIAAILLHDIGHGPFSHVLETSLVPKVTHEALSRLFMAHLIRHLKGISGLVLEVFDNEYKKGFLHQLISGQLDMDRLDYLRRDSFFTGVTEGVVGSERIIKMLQVADGQLVVEQKGIYSIEKFLISRRLMYWQVYLHKTVIAAEQMLVHALLRARELASQEVTLFTTPGLKAFLYPGVLTRNPLGDTELLIDMFARLDDNDIFASLKVWADHDDRVLSFLSEGLIDRKLFAIRIQKTPFDEQLIHDLRLEVAHKMNISMDEATYLVFSRPVTNHAYHEEDDQIFFMNSKGQLSRLSDTSDIINVPLLSQTDQKYFLCFPKIRLSHEPEQ